MAKNKQFGGRNHHQGTKKNQSSSLFDKDTGGSSTKFDSTDKVHNTKPVRCYESHPALTIGGKKIYGGSCAYPVVTDADIYVGFDMSMEKTGRRFPWNPGIEFLFYIPDMGVPPDPEQFKAMIGWLAQELADDKKIHMGCIGGHGRTGMVLAALTAYVDKNMDAIEYVRKNYCHKAVESQEQVAFLMKHFGMNSAAPTKGGWYDEAPKSKSSFSAPKKQGEKSYPGFPSKDNDTVIDAESRFSGGKDYKIQPAKHKMSVWGNEVVGA